MICRCGHGFRNHLNGGACLGAGDCDCDCYVDENEAVVASDIVNSPDHYRAGGIETIDAMRAWLKPEEFEGYLRGNVIKYISRCMRKGDTLNDLKKAAWYLDRLITDLEGGNDERVS